MRSLIGRTEVTRAWSSKGCAKAAGASTQLARARAVTSLRFMRSFLSVGCDGDIVAESGLSWTFNVRGWRGLTSWCRDPATGGDAAHRRPAAKAATMAACTLP